MAGVPTLRPVRAVWMSSIDAHGTSHFCTHMCPVYTAPMSRGACCVPHTDVSHMGSGMSYSVLSLISSVAHGAAHWQPLGSRRCTSTSTVTLRSRERRDAHPNVRAGAPQSTPHRASAGASPRRTHITLLLGFSETQIQQVFAHRQGQTYSKGGAHILAGSS